MLIVKFERPKYKQF